MSKKISYEWYNVSCDDLGIHIAVGRGTFISFWSESVGSINIDLKRYESEDVVGAVNSVLDMVERVLSNVDGSRCTVGYGVGVEEEPD